MRSTARFTRTTRQADTKKIPSSRFRSRDCRALNASGSNTPSACFTTAKFTPHTNTIIASAASVHPHPGTGAVAWKEGDAGPPKMKGSAMLIGAKTREEVEERLRKDVYVEGGVWDLSKVQIIPFKSALRKAL